MVKIEHNDLTLGLKTEKFAASYLGVQPSTMRHWRMRKKGPAYCLLGTRAIRYTLSALDAFIEQCQKNAEQN